MGKSEPTDKARSAKVVRVRTGDSAWPLARGFGIISTPLREHKEQVWGGGGGIASVCGTPGGVI